MKILIRSLLILFAFVLLVNCEKTKNSKPSNEVILEEFYADTPGEIVTITVAGNDLECTKVGDLYIYQGDMVFQESKSSLKGAGITSKTNYWNCNTVYYVIEDGFPEANRITNAIEHWQKYTYIKFLQRTDEVNYVEFIESQNGCASHVGMIGGRQNLWLADWATTGNVIHEIGHALGLKHEHSKPNRDKYITIHEENIKSNKDHNFSKMQSAVFTEGFDFNSIMLYSPKAFSKNGEYTITKLDSSLYTAQRNGLSSDDIETIKAMYRVTDNGCENLEVGQITDIDNNIYKTIKIGDQLWMSENLATTKLNDGTPIEYEENDWSWIESSSPAYCWYENDGWFDNDGETYKETYGALYNYHTVATEKLCPSGWRVALDSDWSELESHLGMSDDELSQFGRRGTDEGAKMKEEGDKHWYSNEESTNESGFTALPGGHRYWSDGLYYNESIEAIWWAPSLQEGGSLKALARRLESIHTKVDRFTPWDASGYSVRCVKDE